MPFAKSAVAESSDLIRIQGLPVRTEADYPPGLVEKMTEHFRTPTGTQKLFAHQARALYDLGKYRLGFYPIGVGGGKSLVSYLAPTVLYAQRPLLLMPAKLIAEAERKWREAGKHWKVARHLRFMSYEMLGRAAGSQKLDLLSPDMLIEDEAHKTKNLRAAVTRRIARFVESHPGTIFIPMSGSFMKDSLKNFGHLLKWSHGQMSPLPLHAEALTEWSEALDEGANAFTQRDPGSLLDLYPGAYDDDGLFGDDNRRRARRVFFNRFQSTPGVICVDRKDSYNGSLQITALEYGVNAATEANFKTLRKEMCRPDGWRLSEAMQVWAVARQLALGMHYEWRPPAPKAWLDARKQWAIFVRDFLNSPRSMAMGIDSEFTTMTAVLEGKLEDTYGVLEAWRKIKPTFEVNPIEVWHDDAALKVCAKWLAEHPYGICWVEHVFFGQVLSKLTGVPYYGAKGLDAKGQFIIDHPVGSPIIASIAANAEGRDLQYKWRDNLVTAPAADSERWEQLIARTHRHMQTADEVTVDVLVGCREHLESIPRALSSSSVKADLLGFSQKLKIADLTWPDVTKPRDGWRWAATEGND